MILHDLNSEKYPYKLEQGKTYYIVEDSNFAYNNGFSLIGKIYAEEETTNIYLSDFIEVKGEAPIDGYVVIGEKNTVSKAVLGVKKYEVTCENNSCKATGNFDSSTIGATSVAINNEETEIELGQTLQLTATVLPENTTNKTVKWTSSDSSIATVDETGLVTTIKGGNVTITATTSNDKIATKNIKIKVLKLTDSNANGTADIGETITIGNENFYVINNDGTTVSMLAYYNLNAGGVYNGSSWVAYQKPTYKQDANMIGVTKNNQSPYNGIVKFSDSKGWAYTKDETIPTSYYNSYLSTALTNYDKYIKGLGVNITSTRLITYNEIIKLGCSTSVSNCVSSGKIWLYSSSYWTGSASHRDPNCIWYVRSNGNYSDLPYYYESIAGVRPVLDISVFEI